MDKQYQLVFQGETLEGFLLADVKRQLGDQMKLDTARLENLFSGKRVVLKRGVDEERAHRHVRQFASMGARLMIEADGAPAPAPRSPAAPAQAARNAAPMAAPAPSAVRARVQVPVAAPPTLPKAVAPAPPPLPETIPAAFDAPNLSLVPTAEEATAEDSITCPHCGEVQPKAVFCRACTTNMPMGMAVRKEAEELARAGRRESTTALSAAGGAQRRSTAAEEAEGATDGGWSPEPARLLGLGFSGRLSRRSYAQASSVSFLLGYLMLLFILKQPSGVRIALGGLVLLLLSIYGVRLCVLRCHDINRSGWWSLLLAVPVLGFLAAIALALIPSTEGDNHFGEMPEEGSLMATRVVTIGCALVIGLALKPALRALDREDALPAAQAGARFELEPAADRAFHVDYAASPGHKAFAVAKGAFGWKSGLGSIEEAEDAALAACDEHRQASSGACEVVNIDGEWLGSSLR